MTVHKIKIRNYKCFDNLQLELPRITVLTGSNGVGKSSVVQAMLLLLEASTSSHKSITLKQEPRFRLGSFEDIVGNDHHSIELQLDDYNVELGFVEDKPGEASIECRGTLPSVLTSQVYYLNAERRGPRLSEELRSTPHDCGDTGEATGSILLLASQQATKIDRARSLNSENDNLQIEVDKWMSYICGEVAFKPEKLSDERYRLKVIQRRGVAHLATNTGFGYTYALPIVVDGLTIENGGLLIVENPEAHLHPKAQSNMGEFLAKIGSSGVNILVETHSEHIVNGIRRSILKQNTLSYEDLAIYFFEAGEDAVECLKITMDEEGNLSDFPQDFFDQVRQDMLEIIRLAQAK